MAALTDIALVAQVAVAGNRRAFDELVRRYQSPVRRFFLNQTLGNGPLSDDLAQDTFLKAYVNLRSFRGAASFQTWLMRIAYNVFYDYVRKEKGKVKSEEFATAIPSVERTAAANSSLFTIPSSLKMDVYAALSLLKAEERTCITLQLIDGYDLRKIADITGMKEGTVKSHLSRGKEKLANYLKQNGYDRR